MNFIGIVINVIVLVLEDSGIFYYVIVDIFCLEIELVVLLFIVECLFEVGGELYEVELFDGGFVDELLFYFSEIFFYLGMVEFMIVEVIFFFGLYVLVFNEESLLLIIMIVIVEVEVVGKEILD